MIVVIDSDSYFNCGVALHSIPVCLNLLPSVPLFWLRIMKGEGMGQFVFVVVVFLWMRENLLTDRTVWQSAAYRKILKISPGAYIFHRPFLRGLFLEGLIYGGKFAFQIRMGKPFIWK